MADFLFLSNDAVGSTFGDNIDTFFVYPLANATSAHGSSGAALDVRGPMPAAGRFVDFGIAVTRPAISASGFVSGTVDATLRVNSGAVLSTIPSINMLTTSAAIGAPVTTQFAASYSAGQASAAVINTASATFNKGDMITIDWNARSVGSAAAGAAGTGFFAYGTIRWNAA